jgi:hypothetical protein
VHNLSPIQSLRERRSGGRETIRGPQKLGLCEGSVYCQGVRSDCGPPSFGDTMSLFNLIFVGTKSFGVLFYCKNNNNFYTIMDFFS